MATPIAPIDCNNFYASCERLFQPELRDLPMAIPGLGPVVVAGWLASTALGAVAGAATGGLIGSLVDAGEVEDTAHVYSKSIRR